MIKGSLYRKTKEWREGYLARMKDREEKRKLDRMQRQDFEEKAREELRGLRQQVELEKARRRILNEPDTRQEIHKRGIFGFLGHKIDKYARDKASYIVGEKIAYSKGHYNLPRIRPIFPEGTNTRLAKMKNIDMFGNPKNKKKKLNFQW